MTPEPPSRPVPAATPSRSPLDPPAPATPARRSWPRSLARRPLALLLAIALLLISTLGTIAVQISRQADLTAESPAQGVARVVAQSVAPIVAGEYVWRAVQYNAQPRADAEVIEQPLSFVLAVGGPILLSNDDPDTDEIDLEPFARLAPGELVVIPAGTRQQIASLTDEDVAYVAVEFVLADDADDIREGTLVFVTDSLSMGDGLRDMDCVNAILRDGESTFIPDTGESTLILATDGAIDVIPSGGRRRTLMPGEGDLFTGELTIIANAEAAREASGSANAKRMLSGLQAPTGGAVFFAGVIGPTIPPEPQPTEIPIRPAETETDTAPPPADDESPAPTEEPPAPTEEPVEPTPEPTSAVDPNDPDGDGLTTPIEGRLQTDPQDPDSDDDGLNDGEEVYFYQTDPRDFDSDDDGLGDGDEVFLYATNPLERDTDGDLCGDGDEVASQLDPLNPEDCAPIE